MSPLRPPSDPPLGYPPSPPAAFGVAPDSLPPVLPFLVVDPATPVSTLVTLAELAGERVRQRGLGYDAAHDDGHSLGELWDLIVDRGNWAADPAADLSDNRQFAVEAAALTVALIESIDRRLHAVAAPVFADTAAGETLVEAAAKIVRAALSAEASAKVGAAPALPVNLHAGAPDFQPLPQGGGDADGSASAGYLRPCDTEG